jgi:4-hydroxybenzoate polyprenyltransferase
MIRRLRLAYVLARPAVIVLLCLFAAIGITEGGQPRDVVRYGAVVFVVVSFLLYAITVNDLADEAIDRVNLHGDRRRPLVVGSGSRHDLTVLAAVTAFVSGLSGLALGVPVALVVVGGLAFATVYSMPPFRLASRGVIAPLTLPLGYVAVPYLAGLFAVRSTVDLRDIVLGAGLYIGFVGRIVLKDFRDVRGDALFGKRTFLVRRGRRATCLWSAVGLTMGSIIVVTATRPSAALIVATGALVFVTLILLRAVAANDRHRRDDALISAIAICGRGTMLVVLAHLTVRYEQWTSASSAALLGALAIVTLGQAHRMARYGPVPRPARVSRRAAELGQGSASVSAV